MKRLLRTAVMALTAALVLSGADAYAIGPKKSKKKQRKAEIEALMSLEAPKPAPHDDEARFERGYVIPETKAELAVAPDTSDPAAILDKKELSSLPASVSALLDEATAHIGKRYKWGASGPNVFDCSGFVMYCFRKMGVSLPHNSNALFSQGHEVEYMDEIRPGDLVFFRGRNVASSIGHVGIVTETYGESFSFVHASTSAGVIVSSYDEEYYHARFVGAKRIDR